MLDLKTVARTAACLTLIVAVAACAKKEDGSAAPVMSEPSARAYGNAPAPAPQTKPASPEMADDEAVTSATPAQQMGSSAATFVDGERKFIRKASARFNVKDVYASALGIEDTVAAHGGFVVMNDIGAVRQSSAKHPIGDGKLLELVEYKVQGQLTVRVPSARTQEFLRAIVSHVVFLDKRTFNAHDAQFDLLRRQLDVVRSQETQSELGQAIADGGKLGPKADAIAARGEIKSARDQALLEKKEFEDQVAFSTITLELYQQSKVVQTEHIDIDGVFTKARPGFFSRIGYEFSDGWYGLLDFIVALVMIWPVLLIGGIIAAVIWRIRRARRKS